MTDVAPNAMRGPKATSSQPVASGLTMPMIAAMASRTPIC